MHAIFDAQWYIVDVKLVQMMRNAQTVFEAFAQFTYDRFVSNGRRLFELGIAFDEASCF